MSKQVLRTCPSCGKQGRGKYWSKTHHCVPVIAEAPKDTSNDKYKEFKAKEMASEMKACYEDAVRTRAFDPYSNIRTARIRAHMATNQCNAIAAMVHLIRGLGEWTDRKAAQEAYRDLMASAYFIHDVEPRIIPEAQA
jgi:hypothetical protein